MVIGLTNLVFWGSSGGGFNNLFFNLNQQGIFSFALPVLLIFVLLFGILEKTSFFDNKAINGIIAGTIALLSMQFGYVSYFFANIFPQLSVALIVILVAILLLGSFFDFGNKNVKVIFGILIGVAFLMILGNSFSFMNFYGSWGFGYFGYWLEDNLGTILIVGLMVFLFYWMFKKKRDDKKNGSGAGPSGDPRFWNL